MKLKVLFVILLCLVSAYVTTAQNTAAYFAKADSFFKKHVKGGLVDYTAINAQPQELNELVAMGQNILVSQNDAAEYQAFWINGYNVLVIKGIIDNYPVTSPLNVRGFFDKKLWTIGGTETTLNNIENKLLRANFPKEARFHFVLVCAGLGCPPIVSQAYLPKTLDEQLQRQTKLALNDPTFVRVHEDKVLLSQIFEWYKNDFLINNQSLIDFVNQYRNTPLASDLKVSFYAYDWTLNKLK